MNPLAAILATHIRTQIPTPAPEGFVAQIRPTVPPAFRGPASDASMVAIRVAASECGVTCARSRAETLARISESVEFRKRLIATRHDEVAAFDAAAPFPPVPLSPVQGDARARMREPERVSATRAREAFMLTEKDLRYVPALLCQNPVIKSGAPMRLFLVVDVRNASIRKHGDRTMAESYSRRRADLGDRMRLAAHSARDKRRNRLRAALDVRGCEWRSDSTLCSAYVATGRGDVDEIADTMAEMAFCFEHTQYRDILDRNIQEMRDMNERYDFHEESHLARSMAVDEFIARGVDMHLLPAHLASGA